MDLSRPDSAASWRTALWILVIVAAGLGFSRAFACATPFVALAVLAGTQMAPRNASIAVLLAWLANQAIGFGLLHYPQTWSTFAWGAAIGIAAMGALAISIWAASLSKPTVVRIGLAFVGAFVAYEGLLYATEFVLPSGGSAFTLPIVARILAINAVAFAILYALHRAVTSAGLIGTTPKHQPLGA